jgi:CRP-like cAMP-binding protein
VGESYDLSYLELGNGSTYEKLLSRCPDIEPMRFRDQEYIVRQGQESDEIYIVLRGSCLIQDDDGGHGVANSTMAVIHGDEEAPAFVGEMAHLAEGVRLASVKSAGATHTLCLQPKHMEVLVNEFPLFTQILCRQFTERLRESNQALRTLGESLDMQAESMFCSDGHVLFTAGDPVENLYQLVDGSLQQIGPMGERTIKCESYFQGFIDPASFFCDGVHETTVRAEAFAAIAVIPKSSREAVVRNFPEMVLHLLRETNGIG